MKHELTARNAYSDYDFFNDAMQGFFPSLFGVREQGGQKFMRTDIKENDKEYVMEVEMPGVDKKDINIDLKEGYLTISVQKKENNDEEKKERYIHRERSFSSSRSYYVGDIEKEAIKAKYENGMLMVYVPKETPVQEQGHRIEIE